MVFNHTFNNISAILVEEIKENRKSLTNFITQCCIKYTSP